MLSLRHFASAFVSALLVIGTATAQDSANATAQKPSSVTITATASTDRIRITTPASIVQMHVEVFAASGEKLFDNEIRGGNVFDWHLQDSQAQRLVAGEYVCVVTVKNIAGRITQKLGAVRVGEKDVSVGPAETAQLSPQQTQAIGPLEENSSWTIVDSKENQTATVIAHDGTDGQITRGRGALSFRLGDFFSGKDQEQMRLTEEGSLGIGTAKPKARLDVAGTIRAREGFVFNDGSRLNVNDKGVLTRTSADGTNTVAATTQNSIAKFTDNAGTVGDSLLNENGNLIELRALSGNGVNPTITNPNNVPGFAQFAFYPASGTNTNMSFTAVPRGTGAANNHAQLSVFKTDVIADPNNYEFIAMRARDADFVLGSGKSGTGQNRPFMLASGFLTDNITNNGQLYLDPNGSVGINTTSPGARLDVAGAINTSTQYNISGNRVFSTAGLNNLFAGGGAGQNNTTGFTNAFFGASAGLSNTMGNNNSFFGPSAGRLTTTGIYNSFFGTTAGYDNATGNYNSFFGAGAGQSNTSGASNVFFGTSAGQSNTTGSYNTAIGVIADVGSGNLTNATAIGANAFVGQSNSLVLGSINGVNGATADTNVGIGTTAPVERLHVGGNAYLNNDGGTSLYLDATGIAGGRKWRWVAGTASQSYGVGNGFGLFDENASAYRLAVGPSGNVGIGITVPSSRFHVNGTSWFQGNNTPLPSGAGAGVAVGTLGGGDGYVFSWDYGAATPKNLLLNSPGGTVAIGTVSPAERLNVGGNAYLNNNGGTNLYLDATGAGGHKWRWVAGTASESYGVGDGFGLFDDTKSLYRLAVDESGRVGISTTTPSASLDVNGTVRVRGAFDLDYFPGGGDTQVCRSGSTFANCSSSLSYKTNVAPFSSGLSFIKQLWPITFDWKQGGKRDVGFGAEDVAKINPLFVTYNDKGEVEGVKYDRLSAAFVNAFKEQQDQIEAQRKQLERQQVQLNEQQDQIAGLKKLICRSYRKTTACQ